MCTVVKPYVNNGTFECLSGQEYWNDGKVAFPSDDEAYDGHYRSMFGPGPSHNGLIYARANHNLCLASERLTAARKPDIPGYHQLLQAYQRLFIGHHLNFFRGLCPQYEDAFKLWTDMCTEAWKHYSDPHQKRLLRMQAWDQLVEIGLTLCEGNPWQISKADWKLKCAEWSKPGKFGRTIVDLATPASLAGFVYAGMLKEAMASTPIHYLGGLIEFCKSPHPNALRRAFEKLINPPGRFYFVYFSDDACLAIRSSTGSVDRYNLDIELCDASHTGAMFNLLRVVSPTSTHSAIQAIIAQCSSPLKLASTQSRSISCVLRPSDPMLYSGVTITGGINGLANTCIALAIAECEYTGGDSIRAAAEHAGYLVTGWQAPLEHIEDLQFLKHSPVLDIFDDWQPCLNLGVMLRASGSCKGDLPGRGDIQLRAREFQASLLQGMYPRTHSTLIDTLKSATGITNPRPLPPIERSELAWKVVDDDELPHIYLQSESLYRRYRLLPDEVIELECTYAPLGVGMWMSSSALTKILALDYNGMATIEHETPCWHGLARDALC